MDHSRLLLGWQLHRNTITGQEDGHGTPIFASRSSKDDQEPSTSFLSFHLPVWSCRHIWPLVETRVSEFVITVIKHSIVVRVSSLPRVSYRTNPAPAGSRQRWINHHYSCDPKLMWYLSVISRFSLSKSSIVKCLKFGISISSGINWLINNKKKCQHSNI